MHPLPQEEFIMARDLPRFDLALENWDLPAHNNNRYRVFTYSTDAARHFLGPAQHSGYHSELEPDLRDVAIDVVDYSTG
jgi:hypothetical protein